MAVLVNGEEKMEMEKDAHELVERLFTLLDKNGWMVASAESCTGGLIAKLITDVSGSSKYFGAGIVTYSNEAKMSILGVKKETLDEHGAVSSNTVEEMVKGVARVAGADCAMAVSGVAGPSGGTPVNPVGSVWFAILTPKGVQTFKERFPGDRDEVRGATALRALKGLCEKLEAEA